MNFLLGKFRTDEGVVRSRTHEEAADMFQVKDDVSAAVALAMMELGYQRGCEART